MDWQLLDDTEQIKTECWFISIPGYDCEIHLNRRTKKCELGFYASDKKEYSGKFDSFNFAKKAGRQLLIKQLKEDIKQAQCLLQKI